MKHGRLRPLLPNSLGIRSLPSTYGVRGAALRRLAEDDLLEVSERDLLPRCKIEHRANVHVEPKILSTPIGSANEVTGGAR